MITLQRVNADRVSEDIYHFLTDLVLVKSYFFFGVFPDVVGSHITSPEQHIGLNFVSDELEHFSYCLVGRVAKVRAPRSSSIFRIFRVAVFSSAT